MEACSSGDTIGMLLNLNEGTLTIFKNNRRLGVAKDGLSGSYCWYATMEEDSAVTIRSGGTRNVVNAEVIKFIREHSGEVGVHVSDVVGHVSQKGFSEVDIRSSITYHDNEGRIYSTIDGDHYMYAE